MKSIQIIRLKNNFIVQYHPAFMLGWSVTRAVKEFTKRRKCEEQSFIFTFPREGEGWVRRNAPTLMRRGFELLLLDLER